jgi:tetratricopeptide (TPR) repeat protein
MAEQQILDSWKEVADYLNRSVKTCQRMERELGLPIHRLADTPKARVFAYKEEIDRWLVDTQHSDKETFFRKSFFLSKKKLIIVLGLIILFVSILTVVTWKIFAPRIGVSPSSGKPSLAILQFSNNTGDESYNYLGRGICDLLTSDLSQSRYLNVFPEDRLFRILRNLKLLDVEDYDMKDLAKVAEYAQVDNVILVNVIKAGEKLHINTSLIKIPSGENIALESFDFTSQTEIFSIVDEIAKRIKAQLLAPPDWIVGDSDKEIDRVTTSSIEALRYFNEASYLFSRGELLKSASCLVKAIEIDPEFASACKLLSDCYRLLPGYEDLADSYMERAFELSRHVSEKERLLIQTDYYWYMGESSWNEAFKTLDELLRNYPDDYSVISFLGGLYRRIGDWDKSIETLKETAQTDNIGLHRWNIIYAFRARGNYADALKYAKRMPEDMGHCNYPYQRTLDMFFRGKLDPALNEAEKLLDINEDQYPPLRLKGDIYLLKDDWIQAEECYQKCLDSLDSRGIPNWQYRNIAWARLAGLNICTGNFDKAINSIKQRVEELSDLGERRWLSFFHKMMANIYYIKWNLKRAADECRNALDYTLKNANVGEKISVLHLQGLIALDMNKPNEARIIADKIKIEVENWLNPRLMRHYYHLMGHIELEKHIKADAITYFEKAIGLLPYQCEPDWAGNHAMYYDSLALAFYKAKNFESAQTWYEKIINLTSGRIYYGDVYAKSFFVMGKIYEQKGDEAKALEYYEKFLTLWKDADPGIAEVEDARKRLAVLKK